VPAPSRHAAGRPAEVTAGNGSPRVEVERGLVLTAAAGCRGVRPFVEQHLAGSRYDRPWRAWRSGSGRVRVGRPTLGRASARATTTAFAVVAGLPARRGGSFRRRWHGLCRRSDILRLAGPPNVRRASRVHALPGSCDRAAVSGRRDFAIDVPARLGMRAGEAAALSLDDVDWRAGKVIARGHGRRSERLP
jgi:integrase/recombinase XerD